MQQQIGNEVFEESLQDKILVVDNTHKKVPSDKSGQRTKDVLKNLPVSTLPWSSLLKFIFLRFFQR